MLVIETDEGAKPALEVEGPLAIRPLVDESDPQALVEVRRLAQSLLVMLAMSVLVFVGVYLIGNPVDILISSQADQAERERAIIALGLDKSLWAQFGSFLMGAVTGDLGRSFAHGVPALCADLRAVVTDP